MFLPEKGRRTAVLWLVVVLAATGLYAIGKYLPSAAVARKWVVSMAEVRKGLPGTLDMAARRFVRPFAVSGRTPAAPPRGAR